MDDLSHGGDFDILVMLKVEMKVMAYDDWATGTACYDVFHARDCSAIRSAVGSIQVRIVLTGVHCNL